MFPQGYDLSYYGPLTPQESSVLPKQDEGPNDLALQSGLSSDRAPPVL
jgi:hypothetical protein